MHKLLQTIFTRSKTGLQIKTGAKLNRVHPFPNLFDKQFYVFYDVSYSNFAISILENNTMWVVNKQFSQAANPTSKTMQGFLFMLKRLCHAFFREFCYL